MPCADLDTPPRPGAARPELHDRASHAGDALPRRRQPQRRDAVRDGRLTKAVIAREIVRQQRRADRHPRRAGAPAGVVRVELPLLDRRVRRGDARAARRPSTATPCRPTRSPARRRAPAIPTPTRALAAELLASAKNQTEHRVVIDMIHDTLLPWCSYLDWEPEPSIVAVANVQHLGTRMEGHLSRPADRTCSSWSAPSHPTPAVGGFPRAEALGTDRRGRGVRAWPLRRVGRLGRRAGRRHVGRGHPLRRVLRRPPQRTARRRWRHRRRQRTAGRAGRDPGQVPGDAVGDRPAVTPQRQRRASSSAATTAALSAACTSTLSRRSEATRTTHVSGSSNAAASTSSRSRRRMPRSPSARATATMSVPCGVPNNCSNRSVGERRRLRQEREDRPAVVVDHHDRAGRVRAAATPSATTRRGRTRHRRAAPPSVRRCRARRRSRSATTPSIPLAPRFACTVTSPRGVPNHSTSRTGIDDATTRWPPAGTLAATARAVPGSDKLASPTSTRRSRLRRARSASRQPSSHAESASPRPWPPSCAHEWTDRGMQLSSAEQVGIGDQPGRATRRRASHARAGEPLRRAPSTPAACRVAARRPVDVAGREAGWRSSASNRTTAACERLATRQRVGEHRPTERPSASASTQLGVVDAVAGHDHATTARASRSAPSSSDDADGGAERLAGSTTGQLAGHPDQRLAERQVEMHRPGPVPVADPARRASARHVARCSSTATPGSWNQRTASP